MILIPKRRAWVTIGVLCAATLAGALAGTWLGRENVRKHAMKALIRDETALTAQADTLLDEARQKFFLMNASSEPYCSKNQLIQFRELIYHSANLRDAGGMRNGNLDCSALFEPGVLPRKLAPPNIIRQDGIRLYINRAPYLPNPDGLENPIVFVIQKGDYYLVEDADFGARLRVFPGNQETTMLDTDTKRVRRISNLPLHVKGAAYDRNEQGFRQGLIYATRCSIRNSFCETLSREIAPIEQENRAQIQAVYLIC